MRTRDELLVWLTVAFALGAVAGVAGFLGWCLGAYRHAR